MQKYLLLIAAALCCANLAFAQTEAPLELSATTSNRPDFILTDPQEIIKHEGEFISLEGCIVSASLRSETNGKPLFINLFDPYPRNLFSVIIWGDDQHKFLSAADYTQKMVRITGRLEKGKNGGRPSIHLKESKQITILSDCK